MQKKILITGASGLLAPYVVNAAKHHEIVTTSRSTGDFKIDLSDKSSVGSLIDKVKPDVVINLAGLTNVDQCEDEPELAFKSNTLSAYNLARSLTEECRLIHVSTDQVYSGFQSLNDEDNVNPINIYGRSKLAGEWATILHENTVVLRTNFFGQSKTVNKSSLSDFFIKSFLNKDKIFLFSDLFFSPLHITTISSMIAELIDNNINGVYNVGSRDGLSKSAFAKKIAEYGGFEALNAEEVVSDELSNRALRPKDIRLNVSKFESVSGDAMPLLKDEIKKLFE